MIDFTNPGTKWGKLKLFWVLVTSKAQECETFYILSYRKLKIHVYSGFEFCGIWKNADFLKASICILIKNKNFQQFDLAVATGQSQVPDVISLPYEQNGS